MSKLVWSHLDNAVKIAFVTEEIRTGLTVEHRISSGNVKASVSDKFRKFDNDTQRLIFLFVKTRIGALKAIEKMDIVRKVCLNNHFDEVKELATIEELLDNRMAKLREYIATTIEV
jgi:hypothetical protein